MQIKKIKTVNGGDQGLTVDFIDSNEKDGDSYQEIHNVTYSHPLSPDLRKSLDELKIHLLRLTRYWDNDMDALVSNGSNLTVPTPITNQYKRIRGIMDDLTLTGITSNLSDFLLIGKMKGNPCPGNLNVLSMNISENSDYPYYEDVIEIIERVYDQVQEYVLYEAVIEAKAIVLEDSIKKDEPFDNSQSDEAFIKQAEEISAEKSPEEEQKDIEARTGVVVEMNPPATEEVAPEENTDLPSVPFSEPEEESKEEPAAVNN